MSFLRWFRKEMRGPLEVEGASDPEVAADLAEEMPDSAEDAQQGRESEEVMTLGGVPLAPPLAPPTPTTIEFEGAKEDAEGDAESF